MLVEAPPGRAIVGQPEGSRYEGTGFTESLPYMGGAFTGIKNIIEKRTRNKKMGFTTPGSPDNTKPEPTEPTQDYLVSFGLIREFMGRIPVISPIHPLTENHLIKILTGSKHNLMKEINRSSQQFGIQFSFTRGALEAIATEAIRKGTRARSLRGTINKIIEPYIYEHAQAGNKEKTEIRISRKMVNTVRR